MRNPWVTLIITRAELTWAQASYEAHHSPWHRNKLALADAKHLDAVRAIGIDVVNASLLREDKLRKVR